MTTFVDGLTAVVGIFKIPNELVVALRDEARHGEDSAQRIEDDKCFLDPRGLPRTARSYSVQPYGKCLERAHRAFFRREVDSLLNEQVLPTRASYLFYEPNDFIGPHYDLQQCQLTVVAPLGASAELTTYDSQWSNDPQQLFDGFQRDPLARARDIILAEGQAILFRGDKLLHARRPRKWRTTSVTFCYGIV